MKKLYIIISSFLLALTANAQDTMFVHQTDGEVVTFLTEDVDSITFVNDSTDGVPVFDPADVAGGMFALTNGHNPRIQVSAAADAENLGLVNYVVAYKRLLDGTLIEVGAFPTGGLGENIRNSGANPLASQDALILSEDNTMLFAVNPGSETVSSFTIDPATFALTLVSQVSTLGQSGGQNPISLTVRNNVLYVANTGIFIDGNQTVPAVRNRINSSIIGFTIGADGSLTELPGSEYAGDNIAANAGSIEFNAAGNALYITERRTNQILKVGVNPDGTLLLDPTTDRAMVARLTSSTDQPFGTDIINVDNAEVLLVSQGNNGVAGLSALSSYTVDNTTGGTITPVSQSAGTDGDPLVTGFTFGCWVEAINGPGGVAYAYVANTPDGTLTGYSVDDTGALTRLDDAGVATGDVGGAGVLDTEIVWPFVYQVVSVGDDADDTNNSRVAVFELSPDGSLTRRADLDQENPAFQPRMFAGIAGF